MAPKPQVLRTDFTADVLRNIADRSLNVRSSGKYALLADIVDGKVCVEDLPRPQQLTVQRYIREINSGPGPEELLDPPRHGPPVVTRTNISADELRKLAQAHADPNHQAAYLTIATLMETNDVDGAAEAHGFSRDHVLRLHRRFAILGPDGLVSLEISSEGVEILRTMLAKASERELKNKIEALLAYATEDMTTTAVRKRFGIPEATFHGYVEQFRLHGADAFKSRSERKASRTADHAAAERLEALSKSTRDPVTKKRTAALAACLRGEEQSRVAKKYHVGSPVLTKWIREFSDSGQFSLFGEGEFKRPTGARAVSEILALAPLQPNPARRTLMEAASSFYSGQRFKQITDRLGVNRLDLYALLWDIQCNDFGQIAATIQMHFDRQD